MDFIRESEFCTALPLFDIVALRFAPRNFCITAGSTLGKQNWKREAANGLPLFSLHFPWLFPNAIPFRAGRYFKEQAVVTRRRRSNQVALATKTAELAFAAPQVIAHRMSRMARSGPVLSERDRKEFHLMGTEKVGAFIESWNAMAWQSLRANQALALSLFYSTWFPWLKTGSSTRIANQWQNAALGVLSKGLAPIHKSARANARRLGRTSF